MTKICNKWAEAFCPNCQVLKPIDEIKCRTCGSWVPMCHSTDPDEVNAGIKAIFSKASYFMGKKPLSTEMLDGLTEFADSLERSNEDKS